MFCDVAQNFFCFLFVFCLKFCRLGPSCHSQLGVALKMKINIEHLWNGKKFSHYRSDLAQRVGRLIALLFHDRGTRRGEWLAARPGRTLLPGKTRYPFYLRNGNHGGEKNRRTRRGLEPGHLW